MCFRSALFVSNEPPRPMIRLFLWHSFETVGIGDISSAQTRSWISFMWPRANRDVTREDAPLKQQQRSSLWCLYPPPLFFFLLWWFSEHKSNRRSNEMFVGDTFFPPLVLLLLLPWIIWETEPLKPDTWGTTSPPGGERATRNAHVLRQFHVPAASKWKLSCYSAPRWLNHDCVRSS